MTPPSAILDQYPSTSDFHTKEPVDDPVLLILKNARERYRVGATASCYIEESQVCAIGAIGAEVGAVEDWEDVLLEGHHYRGRHMFKTYLEHELKISESTKEAIKLLDKSALFLYGDKIPEHAFAWTIEYINQRFNWDTGKAKEAVLQCYDHAILERERAVIA